MVKKSGQKFKHFENEKSFYHEIKGILCHFQRILIEANNLFFLERSESDFKPTFSQKQREKIYITSRYILKEVYLHQI